MLTDSPTGRLARRVTPIAAILLLLLLQHPVHAAASSGAADLEYPDATRIQHIAFGSCHKSKYARPDLWPVIFQTMDKDKDDKDSDENIGSTFIDPPQVWLWTGDAIYPKATHSQPISSLEQLEQAYGDMLDPHNHTIGYGPHLQKLREAFRRRLEQGNEPEPEETPTKQATTKQATTYPLIFGSWDDHDFGANDYGQAMTEKEQRRDLFWDFLGLTTTSEMPRQRKGSYFSVTLGTPRQKQQQQQQQPNSSPGGQIKLLLLDTRWHRSSHCIPSVAATPYVPLGAGFACATRWLSAGLLPQWCEQQLDGQQGTDNYDNDGSNTQHGATILGHEQWEWLRHEIDTSEADLHIIVSSIQVFSTNPAMEGWGDFPKERQKLLDLLVGRRNNGSNDENRQQGPHKVPTRTLILSGDVHHGEFLNPAAAMAKGEQEDSTTTTTTTFVDTGVLEITSSGLTHTCTKGLFGLMCLPILTTFSKHRGGGSAKPGTREPPRQKDYYYVDRNFGRIRIDWGDDDNTDTDQKTRPGPSVTVTIHSAETGQAVMSTGPLSLDPSEFEAWSTEDLKRVVPCMDGHLTRPVLTVLGLLAAITAAMLRRQGHKTKRKTA